MTELEERFKALVDTVRAVMKDEGAQEYTLSLSEMYLLLDGYGALRQGNANEQVDVAEIERLREQQDELLTMNHEFKGDNKRLRAFVRYIADSPAPEYGGFSEAAKLAAIECLKPCNLTEKAK